MVKLEKNWGVTEQQPAVLHDVFWALLNAQAHVDLQEKEPGGTGISEYRDLLPMPSIAVRFSLRGLSGRVSTR